MHNIPQLLTYATALFIITNPIGNAPAILAIIRDFPMGRQKVILAREWLFSLIIAIFFQYFGENFLEALQLKDYTIALCGGILLFFIAISLIFPKAPSTEQARQAHEPYFVPIATPLLAGPSLLTIVMLYSRQEPSQLLLTASIITAWVITGTVLAFTPYIQKIFKDKGIIALEQMMGMILALIATEMVVTGIKLFIETLPG